MNLVKIIFSILGVLYAMKICVQAEEKLGTPEKDSGKKLPKGKDKPLSKAAKITKKPRRKQLKSRGGGEGGEEALWWAT